MLVLCLKCCIFCCYGGNAVNCQLPFVLQSFPQGWSRLKELQLIVTFNCLNSIAKSSRRMKNISVSTLVSENEEDQWISDLEILHPAVNIRFAADEEYM